MAHLSSHSLTQTIGRRGQILLALVALGVGWLFGHLLVWESLRQRPDVALRLCALAALPLPLVLLRLLTTPPNAAVRRLLGEPTSRLLHTSLRAVAGWLGLGLLVPLGVLGSALVHPECREDLQRASAMMTVGILLAAGLGTAGLLAALRIIARPPSALWANLSGGGAFGPAEAAPLLYAPALSLVAAMLPCALLSAVWSVKAAWLSPSTLAASCLGAAALAAVAARREVAATGPWLQQALLSVEEAHATPFAESQQLPQPPRWLLTGSSDAVLTLLARAWVRARPGSWLASAGLVAVTALLARRPTPPAALCALAAALACYSTVRAVVSEQEAAYAAAGWLGARAGPLRRALLRLGAGLGLPALAAGVLASDGRGVLAALVGVGCGVALGLVALAALPAGLARLRPRLPIVAFGAAIAAMTWLAGSVPSASPGAPSSAVEQP